MMDFTAPSEGEFTALINGTIWCGPGLPGAEAVLMHGETVKMTGDTARIKAHAPAGTAVIDLGGRFVTPGLIDSHVHLLPYGLTLLQLDLHGAAHPGEIARRLAEAIALAPEESWIIGRGWDQSRFIGTAAGVLPRARDLDSVSPGNPVLLRRVCGHVAVANSAALKAAGITAQTADPPGGRIQRDPAAGRPTGILFEQAIDLVEAVIPEPDEALARRALNMAIDKALAEGVTGVHSQDVWKAGEFFKIRELYRTAAREGRPFRMNALVGIDAMSDLLRRGLRTGMGDEYFKVGPIKIFADGSLGGGTAALREPYADDPGSRGMLIYPEEELHSLMASVHEAGFQLAIHAIGDGAAGAVIDGMKKLATATIGAGGLGHEGVPPPEDRRHRIIHCQVVGKDQMADLARLGMVADIQPAFLPSDLPWLPEKLGRERALQTYAWRSLLEAGIPAAAGSDAPVEPISPMGGIWAAVSRAREEGTGGQEGPGTAGRAGGSAGWAPGESLDVTTALSLYTVGSAYAAFEEHYRGRLAPGYLADAVVWPRDFRDGPADDLKNLKPDMTILGGRIAYEA